MEWTGSGQQQPLVHRVMIKGTKKPHDFFHLCYYPEVYSEMQLFDVCMCGRVYAY